jgi:hypothetical protein
MLLVGGVMLRDGEVLPLHVIELILKRISWLRVGRKRLWWGTG